MAYDLSATLVLGDASSICRWLAGSYRRAFAALLESRSEGGWNGNQRALQRARRVLTRTEAAVLDLLEGKNLTVEEIAGRTGRGVSEVSALHRRALEALAADLQACANDRLGAVARRNG